MVRFHRRSVIAIAQPIARNERAATTAVVVGLALAGVPLLSGSTFGRLQAATFLAGAALLVAGLAAFAAPARATRRVSWLAAALFLLGLVPRLILLGHLGTSDPLSYIRWGTAVQ